MSGTRSARRARAALDRRLSELGSSEVYAPPRAGWIRAIRDALGIPAAELGRQMGISHSSVFDLERSEREGRIRLDSLRRAAHAMDCDLVYAFIPTHGLEATLRRRAAAIVDEELRAVVHTMTLEDQAEVTPDTVREELIERLIDSGKVWAHGR